MDASIESRDSGHPAMSATWDRLEDQLGWYDRKSIAAQRMYKRLKVLQLVFAAGVPVAAAASAPGWVTAALGAIVLVAEGIQQLGQYQQNWIAYRSTCESLKHEKYLYLAHAGPYTEPVSANRALAERLEGLVSQEHAKWISARDEANAAPTQERP